MTKSRNPVGRPTIVTPEVVEKLEYAFSLGCTDIEACLHADIAPATLYKFQDRNPKFAERKDALKSSPIFLARQSVLKGLKDNPDLALRFLERKKKDEFSLRAELTGKDGENIGVSISASQAEQLIRARANRADS